MRGIEVYVTELDGSVVGFISGSAIREPLPAFDAELFALYLLEPFQRHGINTQLVKKLPGSLRGGLHEPGGVGGGEKSGEAV